MKYFLKKVKKIMFLEQCYNRNDPKYTTHTQQEKILAFSFVLRFLILSDTYEETFYR